MSYVAVAYGTIVAGYNQTLTPAIPVAAVTGNLLVLQATAHQGGPSPPDLSAAGWTLVSPSVNAKQVAVYLGYAGTATAPSVTYGTDYATAVINAYSGAPSSLTGIVHASVDELNTSTNKIGYSALTITAPNCLVIALGARNKTATTNGATFAAIASGQYTLHQTSLLANNSIATACNDWIQTTATSSTGSTQAMSLTDTTQQQESVIIALLPGFNLTFSVSPAAFNLTPAAITLINGPVLTASAAAFNLTPTANVQFTSLSLSAAAAAFAFAPQTAALNYGPAPLAAGAAAFSFTPQPNTLGATQSVYELLLQRLGRLLGR